MVGDAERPAVAAGRRGRQRAGRRGRLGVVGAASHQELPQVAGGIGDQRGVRVVDVVGVVHLEGEGRRGLGTDQHRAALHEGKRPGEVEAGGVGRPVGVAVQHLGDAARALLGDHDFATVGLEHANGRQRQRRVVVVGEQVAEVGDEAGVWRSAARG